MTERTPRERLQVAFGVVLFVAGVVLIGGIGSLFFLPMAVRTSVMIATVIGAPLVLVVGAFIATRTAWRCAGCSRTLPTQWRAGVVMPADVDRCPSCGASVR